MGKTVTYGEIMSAIVCKYTYRYVSYNHKAALQEYNESKEYELDRRLIPYPNSFFMPQELKDKHKVYKVGKLRQVFFNPNGDAWKFKIGNKYAKTFFVEDFGVTVFIIKQ